MSAYGIDVDESQGNIEWEEVKRAGVEFAMLRAGCGEGVIDLKFRENAEKCGQTGIPFGAYWLSYAYTEQAAAREAEYAAETIEEYSVKYPIAFAFTYDSFRYVRTRIKSVALPLVISLTEAFCKKIKEYGYTPMYCAGFSAAAFLREKYALWYVGNRVLPDYTAAIRKFPEKGRIRGIAGEVNRDEAYLDVLGNPHRKLKKS